MYENYHTFTPANLFCCEWWWTITKQNHLSSGFFPLLCSSLFIKQYFCFQFLFCFQFPIWLFIIPCPRFHCGWSCVESYIFFDCLKKKPFWNNHCQNDYPVLCAGHNIRICGWWKSIKHNCQTKATISVFLSRSLSLCLCVICRRVFSLPLLNVRELGIAISRSWLFHFHSTKIVFCFSSSIFPLLCLLFISFFPGRGRDEFHWSFSIMVQCLLLPFLSLPPFPLPQVLLLKMKDYDS